MKFTTRIQGKLLLTQAGLAWGADSKQAGDEALPDELFMLISKEIYQTNKSYHTNPRIFPTRYINLPHESKDIYYTVLTQPGAVGDADSKQAGDEALPKIGRASCRERV